MARVRGYRQGTACGSMALISTNPSRLPRRNSKRCFHLSAIEHAGAISTADGSTVDFLGIASFVLNIAFADGGAISLSGPRTSPTPFTITDVTFISNVAVLGGAVYLESTTGAAGGVRDCVFEGNNASYGGALYLNTGDRQGYVNASVFRDNFAGKRSTPNDRPCA